MMKSWVKEIIDDCLGESKLKVGLITKHPDGRTVQIMSGQYWGTYGLSNFWYWMEILDDGTLGDIEEHGYGW